MYKKSLFNVRLIILTALINSLVSTAQSQLTQAESKILYQKIDSSLSSIQTVIYNVDYNMKFLSEKDTLHTVALCSLYRAPKDRMKAYNIVDLVQYKDSNEINYFWIRRYDGKKSLMMNYSLESLNVYKKPFIDKKRKMRESVVDGYQHYLLQEYVLKESPFVKWGEDIKNIVVTEDTYNNAAVYSIVILYGLKDEYGLVEALDKHIIRKSDYLPIAYTSSMQWESMEQYRHYEVEYLEINPKIPLNEFNVDEDKIINVAERFNILKEKAKIDNK